jgi:hypothetical protein
VTEVPEDRLHDLERGEDVMEEDLEQLGDHLEEARGNAEQQRDRIELEAKSPEDAGTGTGAGDDETSGGEAADAPVHEAERVDPADGGD